LQLKGNNNWDGVKKKEKGLKKLSAQKSGPKSETSPVGGQHTKREKKNAKKNQRDEKNQHKPKKNSRNKKEEAQQVKYVPNTVS